MSDWQSRPWDQQPSPQQPSGWPGQAQPGPTSRPGQVGPGAPEGWGAPASPLPGSVPGHGTSPSPYSPAPQPSPGARSGAGLSAAVVGAVVGLVVGAVGFFTLAPADGVTGGGSGSSGATVTTSPAAGGTEGDAAAAGQAATPQEQVVYDLAAAWNDQDCAAIIALTEAGVWVEAFGASDNEEAAGQSACETYFASGEATTTEVRATQVLGPIEGSADAVRVGVTGGGWEFNNFSVRQTDGVWKIYVADYDHNLDEVGSAAESEDEARLNRPSGRDIAPPTDPPTGNDTFDEIARNCASGLMVACDDLYWVAPRGSNYELYGITCGGRRIGIYAGGRCVTDFGNEVVDDEPVEEEGGGEGEGESSEGEGEDAEPGATEGMSPEEVVEAWIVAGDAADCEAMAELYTERYLEGRTLEEFAADCEAAAAEAEANGGPIPGLVVQSVDEQGDVADVFVTSTEITNLSMRITVAREGDVWLIDFIE